MDMTKLIRWGSIEDFLDYAQRRNWLLHHMRGGSRVICSPPPTDTDDDRLVLVRDLDTAGYWFQQRHWKNCFENWRDKTVKDPGELDETGYAVKLSCGARFQSWRAGDVNVILTDDETLHVRSVAATLLAKEVNLMTKEARIKLFRCIKFGEAYGGVLP